MKFVMSYSCGKDSTLALHKSIQDSHEPVALIVMFNKNADRSYFHGADTPMLKRYSEALDIPLLLTPSDGQDYHVEMEKSLEKAKTMGAKFACFGDIDIEEHRSWCTQRCEAVGLDAQFPLWQKSREENVYELLDAGYKCVIKTINNTILPKSILGKVLDRETAELIGSCGADICGENGEYHTLTFDGPIFKKPVAYTTGEILDFGEYSVIDIS